MIQTMKRLLPLLFIAIALTGCNAYTKSPNLANVTSDSAVLRGHGDCSAEEAGAFSGDYKFQYRKVGTSPWTSSPSTPISWSCPTGGASQDVTRTVHNLDPATAYEYRLKLTVNGTTYYCATTGCGNTEGGPYHGFTTDVEPNGNPLGGGWNLDFSDGFSGSSLDLSKWQPNWLPADTNDDTNPTGPMLPHPPAISCADPANVSLSGGIATHSLIDESPGNCLGYQYSGTGITSNPSYGGSYNVSNAGPRYVEFRSTLGAQEGAWTGLWLKSYPDANEIDIEESGMYGYGLGADEATGSWDAPGLSPGEGFNETGYRTMSSGQHTYAVYWEPGTKIRWYYDGSLVGTATDSRVPDVPLALMADIGAFKLNGGDPVPSGSDSFAVDYVRVWVPE